MSFSKDIIEKIEQIVQISKKNDIDIEVSDNTVSVSVSSAKRNVTVSEPMPQNKHYQQDNITAIPNEQVKEAGLEEVRANIVGISYLQSGPGSDKYVSVGSEVKKGDTLLIVESMKVMNTIASPCDGKVKEILCSNEQAIEYDQLLMIIDTK